MFNSQKIDDCRRMEQTVETVEWRDWLWKIHHAKVLKAFLAQQRVTKREHVHLVGSWLDQENQAKFNLIHWLKLIFKWINFALFKDGFPFKAIDIFFRVFAHVCQSFAYTNYELIVTFNSELGWEFSDPTAWIIFWATSESCTVRSKSGQKGLKREERKEKQYKPNWFEVRDIVNVKFSYLFLLREGRAQQVSRKPRKQWVRRTCQYFGDHNTLSDVDKDKCEN